VLPNLIVAGAGKSGTSSLHLYLDQHPDIVMSTVKEPHFFSDPDVFARGPEFYQPLFPPTVARARYRGESSTGYMIFPGVPERIRHSVPDCRLIFLLRNPVDRAISHYRWLVGLGLETRGFRAAFDSDRDDTPDPRSSRTGNYGYIFQEGCYGQHLARFASHFPPDQIVLLVTEELRADPLRCLNRCCEQLGLEPFSTIDPVSANETDPLRHPRARARLEGRTAKQGGAESLARNVLTTMLGRERAVRLRDAAVASLGSGKLDVPIDVDRSWLREQYSSDVALLRTRDSVFAEFWQPDFPA
jgi:hypothetical protein